MKNNSNRIVSFFRKYINILSYGKTQKKNILKKKIYQDFEKIFNELLKTLNKFSKSKILQDFFIKRFQSIIYGNFINLFFNNLNKKIVKELSLPQGKIGKIKNHYKKTLKDIRLSLSLKSDLINEEYYEKFKNDIKKEYPYFLKIFIEIEKRVNTKQAKKYLKIKQNQIRTAGKKDTNLIDFFTITFLEEFIKKENKFPSTSNNKKLFQLFKKKFLPNYCEKLFQKLKHNSKDMLKNRRKMQNDFESRLLKQWKLPIDLFECLIKVSEEAGEDCKPKLFRKRKKDFKTSAILLIHARSIQISKEILILIKAGYADGANARWRSIYELAVISFFLFDNNSIVSQRYLEHDIVKRYKEAKDYNANCKKLKYPPISDKNLKKIKKERDKSIKKYGTEFKYRNGFEWIPRSILPNPNFNALAQHAKLGKMRPFYNLSSDMIHGGARGFYHIGLMKNLQDKILLIGPTDYGFADPMQNTAISLSQITFCLLNLLPDIDGIVFMKIMNQYVNEIGLESVKIQKQMEIKK